MLRGLEVIFSAIVKSNNLRQNVWREFQKSSKIRQDQKTLISAFALF